MKEADNRRSGRTYRMLRAAFNAAYHGGRVAVIVPSMRFAQDYCMPYLFDLGCDRAGRQGVKVGADGSITFLEPTSPAVEPHTLRVMGWLPGLVFIDHEVVYKHWREIIDLYQRFDGNAKSSDGDKVSR